MFPYSRIEIRIFPDQTLLHHPDDWPPVGASVWEWLRTASEAHCILTNTQAGLFVTVFCGVLDPTTGTLTYCNAGHNPPYLMSAQNGDPVQALRRTGMPLGIAGGVTWEQDVVQLAPGDMLVLYTDGVTEAQNAQEAFFGKERLLKVVRANLGRPAQDVQDALLAEAHEFVGDAPQFDDIALMVVVRGLAKVRQP